MATERGIRAWSLGAVTRDRLVQSTALIGVPFTIAQPTVVGTATYNIYQSNAPRRFVVYRVYGYMTGAGAATDTVVVDNGTNNITDTISVALLSDTDAFDAAQINDANNVIQKGGSLRIVTASGALCTVFMDCAWV